jgi:predicted RNase H-like HicB family nuclease
MMMKYHFKIHKDITGFWAECLELDGCVTQADNRDELYKNCEEVLHLYLDEPIGSNMLFPLPDDSLDDEEDTIKVQVSPEIALAFE